VVPARPEIAVKAAIRGLSGGSQWSHWSERIRGERPGRDRGALEIWGYAGQPSYAAGDVLTLHVSTTASRFDVLIYRDGASQEVVHRAVDVPGSRHETPDDAYATGCGWPAALEIELPQEWPAGAYVVELTAADERGTATQDGFFVLRPRRGARTNPIAVVLATYTWQAYNDWGGASAYSLDPLESGEDASSQLRSPRSAEGFSPRLSLQRPWARGLIRVPCGAPRMTIAEPPPIGWAPRYEFAEWALANGYSHWSACAGWARYDGHFVRWAESHGYAIDLLTQWDLDRDPECLAGYACVVTLGHDEYWTAAGRGQLDAFVEQGGAYARLAGNIFWQIRLEDDGMTQVCHKYVPETDPLASAADRSLRTGAFESREIADPPVTTFGANGIRGVYSRFGGCSPRGVGGFVVYRNDHWAFEGTDLYYGDVLGARVPLVGYESDGLTYSFEHGLPVATGEDGAPPSVQILGLTPVTVEDEDHGRPGGFLAVGDGDLAFATRALFGADTPEGRARIRRGAAVMTWMEKGAGEVFCGGSTEWPYALSQAEPAVERVVANVLSRFQAARDH
jgi:hypothetical protein